MNDSSWKLPVVLVTTSTLFTFANNPTASVAAGVFDNFLETVVDQAAMKIKR